MANDVVAELDRWLGQRNWEHARQTEALLRSARDEIVALRRTIRLGPDLPALTRDEALEEAARVCEESASGQPRTGAREFAAAIRALKER